MLRLRDFATLSLLSLVPQALATFLKVQNNCAFEIYCAGAKNDGRFTNVQNVLPGALYKSELAGDNDNIGTVAKCALNPHIQHPFQMEVAVRNGNTFLDLSAVDGDPFLPYDRYAEVDGVSDYLASLCGHGVSW